MKTMILSVAGIFLASALHAQDPGEGKVLYLENCATCHGLELDGNGPMAGAMNMKPTNLTTLAATNGGTFPVVRVVKRIDGRDPLVAHGSPMPVYGHFFEGDDTLVKSETGQPIMTSRSIADLLAFIAGKQK
ncbi:c-type cytochrome [Shimia biformata]|uniref:c-type cytochrome n=1 Tax=Shimia biformata TaxID=1294299 RepID=UPI001952148C|nr:c-type cytochrome [Shimia biformata]